MRPMLSRWPPHIVREFPFYASIRVARCLLQAITLTMYSEGRLPGGWNCTPSLLPRISTAGMFLLRLELLWAARRIVVVVIC